jgi:hypothetical protein
MLLDWQQKLTKEKINNHGKKPSQRKSRFSSKQ